MKKIGEGYFYNVYDMGNGRVLKKQKSRFRMFLYIFFVNAFLPRAFKEYKNTIKNISKINDVYKKVRENIKDKRLIGSPNFLEGINYDQDKVVTIKHLLKNTTESQHKEIIEQFISLIKKFWAYGCHEQVYNFTINNGANKDGEIIFIDFNEISFDKEDVKKDIQNKTWLKRWSYTHLKLYSSPKLREYYSKRMESELSLENLELLWQKGLNKEEIKT